MQVTMPALLTAEEFSQIPDPPDGSQQELVRGRIIVMPPPKKMHGYVCATACIVVGGYARSNRLGIVLSNDTGVITERHPDTVRGPDVAFWSSARMPQLKVDGYIEVAPDLAIEVLSPSNTMKKTKEKIAEYFVAGAKMAWVIDPHRRSAVVFDAIDNTKVLSEDDELDGGEALPGFRCKVAELLPPEE
jgi:Uma2 family endonuclease